MINSLTIARSKNHCIDRRIYWVLPNGPKEKKIRCLDPTYGYNILVHTSMVNQWKCCGLTKYKFTVQWKYISFRSLVSMRKNKMVVHSTTLKKMCIPGLLDIARVCNWKLLQLSCIKLYMSEFMWIDPFQLFNLISVLSGMFGI